MSLSLIEPTYQDGFNIHTFECPSCGYVELALINSDFWTADVEASEPRPTPEASEPKSNVKPLRLVEEIAFKFMAHMKGAD